MCFRPGWCLSYPYKNKEKFYGDEQEHPFAKDRHGGDQPSRAGVFIKLPVQQLHPQRENPEDNYEHHSEVRQGQLGAPCVPLHDVRISKQSIYGKQHREKAIRHDIIRPVDPLQGGMSGSPSGNSQNRLF